MKERKEEARVRKRKARPARQPQKADVQARACVRTALEGECVCVHVRVRAQDVRELTSIPEAGGRG